MRSYLRGYVCCCEAVKACLHKAGAPQWTGGDAQHSQRVQPHGQVLNRMIQDKLSKCKTAHAAVDTQLARMERVCLGMLLLMSSTDPCNQVIYQSWYTRFELNPAVPAATPPALLYLCCCPVQAGLALQEPEHQPGFVRLTASSSQAPHTHRQLLGAQ